LSPAGRLGLTLSLGLNRVNVRLPPSTLAYSLAGVDPVGAFLWRVVRPLRGDLHARLAWARDRRRGSAVARVVDASVRPGDVVLDIGAAYSIFTYRCAAIVGTRGHVHAFEPNPVHWPDLERAARKRNVTFHPLALSDARGEADFHVPLRSDGSPDVAMGTLEAARRESGPWSTVRVGLDTLDHALGAQSRVDFIKIDVEGHEHAVFEGGRETVAQHRPTIVVEIEQRHRDQPVLDTFDLLIGLGYRGYAIRREGLSDIADFDVERDQTRHIADQPDMPLPPPAYVNDFLFVGPDREVSREIAR
jgi:FkbM family methyltransferase